MSFSEPNQPAPQALDRLVALLATEHHCTSIEIAETLWLATQIEPVATRPTEAPAPEPTPVPTVPVDNPLPPPEPDPIPEVPTPAPRANLTLPTPQAGVLPPSTLPVWVADPAMLTNPLETIRALRPLLKRLNIGLGKRLDEAPTVDAIARTQICVPILAPEQRPYFDLVVVVDRSASMHIWQRLIKDIVRILKRYGLFWNVQVYDLQVDPDATPPHSPVTLISNPQRPGHRPSELIDQRGQRLMVVLSDCAAIYWWDGTLLDALNAWEATMPSVIWHMLPAWMWRRTALGQGTAAAFSSDRYGISNHQLTVQIQEYEDPEDLLQESSAPIATRRLPMPVITSEVGDLAQWSAMVAGDRRQMPPGFVLPSQGGSVPRASTYEDLANAQVPPTDNPEADLAAQQQALDHIARSRVERFLQLASPAAQRLVMLLAAAPVITLPVVRLIRDSMLYDVASPLPVAEVFLSGLLQRLPGQITRDLEQASQADLLADPLSPQEVDPLETQDLVQYDFAPRVRQVLLEFLPPADTLDVINNVSAAVERRWNQVSTEDFRAFLTDPTIQVPEALQSTKSFASVTADILAQLGPDYAEFAETLRRGTAPPPPEPVSFDPSDFPLQDIEYEVAEYLNLPPLETFEFIEAHFEDDTDNLEPFEFTIATLHRGRGQWRIQRQQGSAYRLTEPLSELVTLEMVAIPGGTFLMGSPKNKKQRSDSEGPQYSVTVQPFLMGRYPITQAQWQMVTALPPVKRELDSNPSRFKGAMRPVERVTWYDAVEFCARLSAHTGRQYRLPTEAEWEYACRAGTTTPFHFGKTITSDLANYDSNSTYADGPKGEYREEITPVDHFGIANAFGLCDMHGNVYEWCQDHWHSNYEDAPTDGSAWSTENDNDSRILRGGSWIDVPWFCRSAYRDYNTPDDRSFLIGFRVCCSAPRAL